VLNNGRIDCNLSSSLFKIITLEMVWVLIRYKIFSGIGNNIIYNGGGILITILIIVTYYNTFLHY
jgi:hypothetical protein